MPPHTSAYVSIREDTRCLWRLCGPVAVSDSLADYSTACHSCHHFVQTQVGIRQHMSAYVSICQHMSAYVRIRQHMSAYVSMRATCRQIHVSLPQWREEAEVT
jgi:hypothetical protein